MSSNNADDEVTSSQFNEDAPPLRRASAKGRFKKPARTPTDPVVEERAAEPSAGRKVYMSPIEERALLTALRDLTREGWKAGSSWKRGWQEETAKRMKKQVKGCRIMGKNIDNKVHNWGKIFRLLDDFLKLSGVALDQGTYSCVVEDGLWKEYEQNEKYKRFLVLRGKTFSYYPQWCELYGLHRATGAMVQDFQRAERGPLTTSDELNTIIDNVADEEVQESDPIELPTEANSPVVEKSPSGPNMSSTIHRGKRKKGESEESDLSVKFNNTITQVSAACSRFDAYVSQKAGLGVEQKRARMETLVGHMEMFPEMNIAHRIRLIDRLMKNEDLYLYWDTVEHDGRREFVRAFMDGQLD